MRNYFIVCLFIFIALSTFGCATTCTEQARTWYYTKMMHMQDIIVTADVESTSDAKRWYNANKEVVDYAAGVMVQRCEKQTSD